MVLERLETVKKTLLGLASQGTMRQKVKALADVKEAVKAGLVETRSKPIKEKLSKIYNVADSLIGGLSTSDYTKRHVSQFRTKALVRIHELIRAEQASPSDKPKKEEVKSEVTEEDILSEDDDFDEQVIKESDKSAKTLEKLLENAPHLIKKYSKSSKLLSEIHAKKFIMARGIPVIPLTTPIMSYDELRKMHFPVDRIGQYTVLENQIVLGLNVNWANSVKQETKRKPAQMAEFIVKQMNSRTGNRYLILGPAYHHKRGLYFWIAPQHHVDLMLKATGGLKKDRKGAEYVPMNKRLVVDKWGFAF